MSSKWHLLERSTERPMMSALDHVAQGEESGTGLLFRKSGGNRLQGI
ncbi:MAG: hypothetical protein PHP95_08720 [Desulfuromonadaceae bacterium]|nr:hypothetical protein [Desulfuromonadaceae bacterium]MDD2848524.1 hypothetical protein [Desulfuromonadaceae bacterium]